MDPNTLSLEEVHKLIGELTLQNYILRKLLAEKNSPKEVEEKKEDK
jgi:hypothetical protein